MENVKAGDVVIEHCQWENVIATVTKVTATQIVIRGGRYRKKDGYLIGCAGSWYHRWISLPKEGEIEEMQRREFVSDVVFKMRLLHDRDVTYEQAVKIKEVLGL